MHENTYRQKLFWKTFYDIIFVFFFLSFQFYGNTASHASFNHISQYIDVKLGRWGSHCFFFAEEIVCR